MVGDGELIKAVLKRVGVEIAAPHTREKAAKAGVFADLVLRYLEYRAIDHVVLDAVLGAVAREIGVVLAHAVA